MALSSKVGTFSTGTGAVSSTVAVTGVGFLPKLVLFWWSGTTQTADSVGSLTIKPGFGAMSGLTSRGFVTGISIDGLGTTDSARYQSMSGAIGVALNTTTIDGILDFSSFDSDGFTLVVDNQFADSYTITYLAIGGDDLTNVKIGSSTQPTGTGNTSITGVGFLPTAVLFGFSRNPSLDTFAASLSLSLGWATSSSAQGVSRIGDRDNTGVAGAFGYGYDGEVMVGSAGGTAIDQRLSFVSCDSDGFTLNNLENLADNSYYMYVAIKGPQVVVGNFLTQTSTSSDITETLGFQPKAVLISSANRAHSTQDTNTQPGSLSIGGFTTTSNVGAQAVFDDSAVADSETSVALELDSVYINISASDVIQGLAYVYSISSTDFVLRMSDADPSQSWATYVALGDAATGGDQNVSPTGIVTAGAFGTATITTGSVNVSPTGIATAEAFGTATVSLSSGPQNVSPTGIATAGAFGTATVNTTFVAKIPRISVSVSSDNDGDTIYWYGL